MITSIFLSLLNKLCKNAHCNFPERKVISSDYLSCSKNSTKSRYWICNDREQRKFVVLFDRRLKWLIDFQPHLKSTTSCVEMSQIEFIKFVCICWNPLLSFTILIYFWVLNKCKNKHTAAAHSGYNVSFSKSVLSMEWVTHELFFSGDPPFSGP